MEGCWSVSRRSRTGEGSGAQEIAEGAEQTQLGEREAQGGPSHSLEFPDRRVEPAEG